MGFLVKMDHSEDLQQQIAEYRAANAARRARAFIDCPDYVLGLPVRQMTLPTWTMLHATGCRFVAGGVPLEGDVRNYLWFHSRLFTQGRFAKPLKWLALLPFSSALHRKKDEDYYCTVIAMAIVDIKNLIAETFADAPKGRQRDGSAAPACLEAQLVHLFTKEYGWSTEKIKRTPLAQLLQLARCFGIDEDDEGERNIRFAHLKKRNNELADEKAAQPA